MGSHRREDNQLHEKNPVGVAADRTKHDSHMDPEADSHVGTDRRSGAVAVGNILLLLDGAAVKDTLVCRSNHGGDYGPGNYLGNPAHLDGG